MGSDSHVDKTDESALRCIFIRRRREVCFFFNHAQRSDSEVEGCAMQTDEASHSVPILQPDHSDKVGGGLS